MDYKIAIDTVFFNRSYSGISKVWENILTGLSKFLKVYDKTEEKDNTYKIILLVRGNVIPDVILKINANNIYTIINIVDFDYCRMGQDVDILDDICKKNNISLFLSTYFTYCTVVPNILMVHDMIPEIFKMFKNQMWIQKELAIKNASGYITISNTTKSDLLNFYPHIKTNELPIHTIYNGIEHIHNPKQLCNIDFLNNFLLKNNIHPGTYIFTIITNNEEYKNLQLINQLALLYGKKLSASLNTQIPIIILNKDCNGSDGYKCVNNALYISNVSNSILNTLYNNALCYINPSKYEGFGLPIFEAFNHKIPVIALDLPIYQELCPESIFYIENNVDDLYNKICYLLANKTAVKNIKKIDKGIEYVKKYSIDKQITGMHNIFSTISKNNKSYWKKEFINLIFQSYNEKDPERKKELEYCMVKNLNNPYVKYIHDFGHNPYSYLPDTILSHPKYISVKKKLNNHNIQEITKLKFIDIILEEKYWLKYEDAFKYSNQFLQQYDSLEYGNYWAIINCDIFLDDVSTEWHNIRCWLNNNYILAQSRHEYNYYKDTGESISKMDETFARTLHSTTQDAWFYYGDLYSFTDELINECNFEIGLLGCDNAIAHRIINFSNGKYKVINKPITFKIMHYDSVRGKNSNNFIEKHIEFQNKIENNDKTKSDTKHINKPINKHPERAGTCLIPNYDQLLGNNLQIDLINTIKSLGGISNLEIYKLITEMISTRIIIQNPN
jgi:hypothetical protein